jgi:hypothetical protein
MLLKVSDIPPYEAFRLCCSDRRLQAELKGQQLSSRLPPGNSAPAGKHEEDKHAIDLAVLPKPS